MKITLLLPFCLLMLSCQPDFVNPKESERAEALKDGENWTAFTKIVAYKKDDKPSLISFLVVDEDKNIIKTLYFEGVDLEDGMENVSYTLVPRGVIPQVQQYAAAFYDEYQDDFHSPFYDQIDCPNAEGTLTIEQIDGRDVSGSFSVCIDSPEGIVSYSNGTFQGKIDYLR
ncbi:MAG: hypothetical protein GYB31_01750 [Bacteroidetes bacterium]|nr:hypothetical protein [Bacteroidota bacterium]